MNEIIVKAVVAATETYLSLGQFCNEFSDEFGGEPICVPAANTSLPNVIVDKEVFSHYSMFDDDFKNGVITLTLGENEKLSASWSKGNNLQESPFYDGKTFPLHCTV